MDIGITTSISGVPIYAQTSSVYIPYMVGGFLLVSFILALLFRKMHNNYSGFRKGTMMKIKNVFPIALTLALFALPMFAMPNLSSTRTEIAQPSETSEHKFDIVMDAWASGWAYDVMTGTWTYAGNTHNILTDVGANNLMNLIGGQTKFLNATIIALSNTTAAQATSDTTLGGEYASCGFTKTGGYYSTCGTGCWNLTYTFTSTCGGPIIINGTGIYNATGTNQLMMEATYPTTSTLNNVGDKFNATWGFQAVAG